MIQLIINGITLTLTPGTRVNREVETAIFNKEQNVYDINLPFDIKLTEDTRKALGFPDILANADIKKEYDVQMIIDSVFVSNAKAKVLDVSLADETCKITILGQYRNLADFFGTKKVNELELGGFQILERDEAGFEEINYTFADIEDGLYNYGALKLKYRGYKVNAYMTAVANGIITTDFLFPKAVDKGSDLPGNFDGYSIINAYDHDRDRYVDADLYNAMNSEWKFLPSVSPMNVYETPERHFWVPMYKLISVIKAIFIENGLTLEGDVLTDTKFAKIVLFNTHAINTGVSGVYTPGLSLPDGELQLFAGPDHAFLSPGNHLPKMNIVEFLIEIGKRYNWQFKFDPISKHVKIQEDRKLVFAPDQIIHLTEKINKKPVLNYERADAFLNGYRFSFADDPADSAITDDVVDDMTAFDYTVKFNFRGSIDHFSDIGTIASPVVKDLVYIKNINSFYEFLDGDGWTLHTHNIASYRTANADNLQDITTQIVSNPMDVFPIKMIELLPGYAMVGPLIGDIYTNEWESVPFSNIGITYDRYDYIDWDNGNGIFYAPGVGHPWLPQFFQDKKKPKAHLPHVVTCVGFRQGIPGSDREYVMATSGLYDNRGVNMNEYSGSWSGIYDDWWKQFTAYFEKSFSADFDVTLDIIDYSKIDFNSTLFIIDNLFYLCRKGSIVMPFPSVSKLSLIRV